MRIAIQERDRKVLKYVFENRVATVKQIKRLAFENSRKNVVYQRLHELRMIGMLYRTIFERYNNVYIQLEPTPKGFECIRNLWAFEVDRPHYKSESPQHDIRLGDLRFEFERLKCFDSFLPENLLSSSTELQKDHELATLCEMNPDAALFIEELNGLRKMYAVEFEMSKKSPDRYHRKLLGYYTRHVVDGVLYFCSEQQVLNAVARADIETRGSRDPKVYFALERDVLGFIDKMQFKDSELNVLEFT